MNTIPFATVGQKERLEALIIEKKVNRQHLLDYFHLTSMSFINKFEAEKAIRILEKRP